MRDSFFSPKIPERKSNMFQIVNPSGDLVTVLLSGEIDHHSASIMRPEIDRVIEEYRPRRLILDFGGVTFMDSSGIGLVMGRYKLISQFSGTVAIQHVPKALKRVMKLSGLYDLAKIHDGGIDDEDPKPDEA